MDPVAIELRGFAIYWYGVLLAAGFIAGGWTACRRAPRTGVPAERIMDLIPWLIGGAIVGARLLFVISYWETDFKGEPFIEIFMIRHGGLVYYGGLIGASLAGIGYAKWKRLSLWKVADILAPSIALGYVFGRLGCLMNGCCFGEACELPWAIEFPIGHPTHPVGEAAIPVHPTQIYDALLNLGLYAGLAWLYRRKRFDGQVFAVYLIVYSMTRSLVETFRGDYAPQHLAGPLTPAHLVSIGIFLAGVILFFVLRRLGGKAAGEKPRAGK